MTLPFQITFKDLIDRNFLDFKEALPANHFDGEEIAHELDEQYLDSAIHTRLIEKEIYNDATQMELIIATIEATINKYRAQFGLPQMKPSHPTRNAARWPLIHENSIYDELSTRPNRSANLAGLEKTDIFQTSLFLEETLLIKNQISHAYNFRASGLSHADAVETSDDWQATDLSVDVNILIFAADVVANLAASAQGKRFLTQNYEEGTYVGAAIDLDYRSNRIVVSLASSSITPKVV